MSGFLPFPGRGGGAMVRVLVGDGWPGGARVQLEFPYQVCRSGRDLRGQKGVGKRPGSRPRQTGAPCSCGQAT